MSMPLLDGSLSTLGNMARISQISRANNQPCCGCEHRGIVEYVIDVNTHSLELCKKCFNELKNVVSDYGKRKKR